MADKFDSTADTPYLAREAGGPEEDDVQVEETGTTVDLTNNVDENVEIEADGSAIINPEEELQPSTFTSNLAEVLDEGYMQSVANELVDKIDNDKSTREDWEQAYTIGLDLLGFKYEERTRPFRGAASVHHPVLAQAVTQFQAMAYVELLPSDGPVRTQVVGANSTQLQQAAERVKDYMNYEITHVMEDYNPEMDQLLFQLPLSGSAFKKIYFDEVLNRATSKFIPAEDVIVPYGCSDLDTCERITQVLKMSLNDLRKKQVSGFYLDVDLQGYDGSNENGLQEKKDQIDGESPGSYAADDMAELYEIHVDLDLEGFEDINPRNGEPSGIKLPYIVTIDRSSQRVLSIYRNYNEGDPIKKRNEYFVHYKFLPGLGFYGFGLIHLIGGLSRTATDILRQLLDAGTLSNLPAGFKSRGIRMRDDADPLQPGEFRDIDAPNGDLRNSFIPLPYKEPSQTLYSLLGFVVQAGQRFASIADMQVGDANQQAPVGTTIALLERGSRIMSAIHKRCYYSQKKEFRLLYKVFADYLPETYPYSVEGADRTIKAEDFDGSLDVLPVSDPNIFSTAQRVTLAQTELQLAQSAPDLHNMKEAYRRMYEALGVKDVDEILRKDTPVAPKDPATEHADLLDGNLMRAYEGQDHDAHIQNHLIFGTNQMILANPPMAMKLQKHILEHVSLKAKEQTAFLVSQGQVAEDQMDQVIARLEAQFMGELKQTSQQLTGGGQPDPAIQLKQQELQQNAQKDQMDAQVDQAKLQLDAEKLRQKTAIDQARIQKDYDIADKRAEVQYDKMTTQSLNQRSRDASNQKR